jgi:hypothetical protein
MNQGLVRGMFVKGMSLIPLTNIPLTIGFMERGFESNERQSGPAAPRRLTS